MCATASSINPSKVSAASSTASGADVVGLCSHSARHCSSIVFSISSNSNIASSSSSSLAAPRSALVLSAPLMTSSHLISTSTSNKCATTTFRKSSRNPAPSSLSTSANVARMNPICTSFGAVLCGTPARNALRAARSLCGTNLKMFPSARVKSPTTTRPIVPSPSRIAVPSPSPSSRHHAEPDGSLNESTNFPTTPPLNAPPCAHTNCVPNLSAASRIFSPHRHRSTPTSALSTNCSCARASISVTHDPSASMSATAPSSSPSSPPRVASSSS
mmetsp:Transcript_4117/g.15883  ORF Transcript_4117/g.15883 Transcript_4117/m.15883 type:complete len:273 (-) Transcript_4117:212-1030(-)